MAAQQQWIDLDRRGNWLTFAEEHWPQSEEEPVSRVETRTANGVNAYTDVDGDEAAAAGLAACKKQVGKALKKTKSALKRGLDKLKGFFKGKGDDLAEEAAKEAVQGVGFDMLIVCGFAFDPHVSEEVKRYGTLTVLPTKMNPDLAMGDELLKKTGAGNLFMVFGEPDVEITKGKYGKLTVEINGVDVYDPTTGQIRNSSTDDIACWFIDTDYNGESFFVRHAYFTGADEPYEKLKRALRAEIDEAAWSSLYSTKSRPFDKPETGRIAVKVINHYGDEVLKVFEV